MNRLKAAVIVVGGMVLVVLGVGMWESPEINWNGFVKAWSTIGHEIVRLKDDPFAILGILVIIAGVWVAYHGIKRLVAG